MKKKEHRANRSHDLESTWALTKDVPPTSAVELAIRRMRNSIILGDFEPGQKLVEADISRELGVSRASVREVLRVLAAERLVELVPNRGPSVAQLNHRDVEDIHDVWEMLTGEAVYRFTELASTAEIRELESALHGLSSAIKARDPYEQLAATNRFFALILARCGNRVLQEMIIGLVSRINFLRAQLLLREGWGQLYGQEIAEIADSIVARRPEAARSAARRHITSACAAARKLALSGEMTKVAKTAAPNRSMAARSTGKSAPLTKRKAKGAKLPVMA